MLQWKLTRQMSSGALRWWEAYATGVACDSSNKFSSLSTRFSRRPTQKNDFNVFGTIRSAVSCRIVPHSAVAVAPKYSSVPNSKQCSRSTNIVGIISFVVLRSRPPELAVSSWLYSFNSLTSYKWLFSHSARETDDIHVEINSYFFKTSYAYPLWIL